MTSSQIATLVLGSAVLASAIAAVIAAIANHLTKKAEIRAAEAARVSGIKEERLRLAVEMARMNLEGSKVIAEHSATSRLVMVTDPAELVCLYLEALKAIADEGATFDTVLKAMHLRMGTIRDRPRDAPVDPLRG